MTQVPPKPKIYHILHIDKLDSILQSRGLLPDSVVMRHQLAGTTIGMNHIKQRRLTELCLQSHPDLYVGQCVPFYFCPRSVMLYLIDRKSNDLSYTGGQAPIIHLEADLHETIDWAVKHSCHWAFTLGNAGSRFFEDRADVNLLHELDWAAINATNWKDCRDAKQAEFLVERGFPWPLVERIGVYDQERYTMVMERLQHEQHKPIVSIEKNWYY